MLYKIEGNTKNIAKNSKKFDFFEINLISVKEIEYS